MFATDFNCMQTNTLVYALKSSNLVSFLELVVGQLRKMSCGARFGSTERTDRSSVERTDSSNVEWTLRSTVKRSDRSTVQRTDRSMVPRTDQLIDPLEAYLNAFETIRNDRDRNAILRTLSNLFHFQAAIQLLLNYYHFR